MIKTLKLGNKIFTIALIIFIIKSLFPLEIYLYSPDLEFYSDIVMRILFAIGIITYLKPLGIMYEMACKWVDKNKE